MYRASFIHSPRAETANRLDFARWVTSRNNPLMARVTVNRMWLHYFGKGIVVTENDFGTQGSAPSHPALLDWLATEFMRAQWSRKAMHRLMVTSATYRQSSKRRADLADTDPYNKLLGRQSRLRLDAEIVRDNALAASGLLNTKMGGPGVFPPQPPGCMNLGQHRRNWTASKGKIVIVALCTLIVGAPHRIPPLRFLMLPTPLPPAHAASAATRRFKR